METADFDHGLLSVEQRHCDFYIRMLSRWNYYDFRQKFCLWSMLLGNGTDFSGDGCGSRGGTGEGTEDLVIAEIAIDPKGSIPETYSEISNDV